MDGQAANSADKVQNLQPDVLEPASVRDGVAAFACRKPSFQGQRGRCDDCDECGVEVGPLTARVVAERSAAPDWLMLDRLRRGRP